MIHDETAGAGIAIPQLVRMRQVRRIRAPLPLASRYSIISLCPPLIDSGLAEGLTGLKLTLKSVMPYITNNC